MVLKGAIPTLRLLRTILTWFVIDVLLLDSRSTRDDGLSSVDVGLGVARDCRTSVRQTIQNTRGDLVSKETVCCVGERVKHKVN